MKTSPNTCKECPYKRNAIKGYLGEASFRPKEFLLQLETDVIHPCHLSVDWDNDDTTEDKPVCNGALKFMNNQFKLSKFKEIRELQKQVGKDQNIFMNNQEFILYHEK